MRLPLELAYVAAGLLAVMGAPLALAGAVFERRIRDFNARCVAATGRIVGQRTSRVVQPQFTTFYPLVEFIARDGRSVRIDGLGTRAAPQLGASVALLYHPDRPADVSFTGPRGRAGIATSLRLLGFAMLLLGLCVAGAAFGLRVAGVW